MTVIAAELEATGWVPVDETGRYHALRYGDAVFNRHEVASFEGNGRRRERPPLRAPACHCRNPNGRLEEGICWKCGRKAP